jgi:uncharacterized membrane protein
MRISFPTLSLAGLALLIAGCASSRATPAPGAASSASANAVSSDSEVNAVVARACYECHSTGGSAPWYAAISPTYLAANSARRVLNFSDWQTYDPQRKAAQLKHIGQSVSSGSMPPGDYTVLDHSARLSEAQKQLLMRWASQPAVPAH